MACRAIAKLNVSFAIDGHELIIGASIGIAIEREAGDLKAPMPAADKSSTHRRQTVAIERLCTFGKSKGAFGGLSLI